MKTCPQFLAELLGIRRLSYGVDVGIRCLQKDRRTLTTAWLFQAASRLFAGFANAVATLLERKGVRKHMH